MFRLVRTIILVLIAFVAGLMFERSQTAQACSAAGGEIQDGVCRDEG